MARFPTGETRDATEASPRGVLSERPEDKRGKQIRDIGAFTAIPMMLFVGPALGYYLGSLIEKKWDHAPWPTDLGAVFGLAAAARQIWLLVRRDGRGS